MSDRLRSKAIRLAASLPRGSVQRRALLDVVKQADAGALSKVGVSGRKPMAEAILGALDYTLKHLGDMYGNKPSVSADFRTVEGSTMMDELPRSESGLREYEYNAMIAEGTSRAKKAVESALSSYMKDIARITYYAGGKSWMHVTVTLK